jgi:phospholipid/cholesterol/gamma-HCH transport system permease protein
MPGQQAVTLTDKKPPPAVLKEKPTSVSFTCQEDTLELSGSLSFDSSNALLLKIDRELKNYAGTFLKINLDGLTHVDSGGITALYLLRDKYAKKGITVLLEGGSSTVNRKLDLFHPEKTDPGESKATSGFFEKTGRIVLDFFKMDLLGFLQLAADITYWSITDIFRRQSSRRGEFARQAVLIGVNAVPIVATMSFIIGLVLALQSAAQLRSFGANIYIADLTVIAMMSEMGPLITAIMVAGRSGSAIAAEIASMKVTSETDALYTMGLNPIRFIMVPKMHGGIMTLPFLTIIADTTGIVGGLVIAATSLDISPHIFLNRMGESLLLRDILFGILKSLVFAYLIVLAGSYFGLKVKRGAAEVGRVTTAAVVVSISLVIIADSIMGLLFY